MKLTEKELEEIQIKIEYGQLPSYEKFEAMYAHILALESKASQAQNTITECGKCLEARDAKIARLESEAREMRRVLVEVKSHLDNGCVDEAPGWPLTEAVNTVLDDAKTMEG